MQVIGQASGQSDTMSGHREMWRGVDRCRGADSSRGAKPSLCNVLLVLTVNFSSLLLFIVQELWVIKYKNNDHVAQWFKTSWPASG